MNKVVAAIVCGVLLVAAMTCGMTLGSKAAPLLTASIPAQPAPERTVPYEAPSKSNLPGLESLTNEFGIRLKVVPVKDGLRCLDRLPNGSPVGLPLKLFRPVFVFAFHPSETEPEFVQVGARRGARRFRAG